VADMLPLLRRCGFDAAQLAQGESTQAAERVLGLVHVHCQGPLLQVPAAG